MLTTWFTVCKNAEFGQRNTIVLSVLQRKHSSLTDEASNSLILLAEQIAKRKAVLWNTNLSLDSFKGSEGTWRRGPQYQWDIWWWNCGSPAWLQASALLTSPLYQAATHDGKSLWRVASFGVCLWCKDRLEPLPTLHWLFATWVWEPCTLSPSIHHRLSNLRPWQPWIHTGNNTLWPCLMCK